MTQEAKRFPLSAITVEPAIQSRAKHIHPSTVQRYRGVIRATRGDGETIPFPPVTLARIRGNDQLWLVDGFHRLAAHAEEGIDAILATVVDVGCTEEVLWLAAEGNLQHGLPLNASEVREAFRRFVKAKGHLRADPDVALSVRAQRPKTNVMTLGEIGRKFGKGTNTISRWFEQDFAREFRRLYKADREELSESNCGGNYSPTREATPMELVSMSLENAERVIRATKKPDEKRALIRALAASLVEVGAKDSGTKDTTLTFKHLTLGSSELDLRTVSARVEVKAEETTPGTLQAPDW